MSLVKWIPCETVNVFFKYHTKNVITLFYILKTTLHVKLAVFNVVIEKMNNELCLPEA